jgi:hypothetical protein
MSFGCDERVKSKTEGSTRFRYRVDHTNFSKWILIKTHSFWVDRGTGTPKEKIETRLIDERLASVMGKCVLY